MVSYHGERITSHQVARSWREAKAGITKRIRLYDLRHFYITHALKAGANIMDLAPRVGHASPEMITKVYAHLVDKLEKKEPLTIPSLYVDNKMHVSFYFLPFPAHNEQITMALIP